VSDRKAAASPTPALCIIGTSDIRSWGLTPPERTVRAFAQAGVSDLVSVAEVADCGRPVICVRGDVVMDPPLVTALIEKPDIVLLAKDGERYRPGAVHASAERASAAATILSTDNIADLDLKGFRLARPEDMATVFWKKLRKRETPYALFMTSERQNDIEWRMFMGTYKGATDFVTKYLWPRPAFYVTRAIAPLGISPNMVTTLSAVCVVVAYFLFQEADWWSGLAAAWAMMFLDTVDGKLARVTLTSSKWGDIFDHGIDLIHPPFWYAAWAIGLSRTDLALSSGVLWSTIGVIFAGYMLQRILEGISIKAFGLEIHIWRRVDTLFRQITARRNPNIALLTLGTLIGRPDMGLIAVAVWVAVCLFLHTAQLLQAALANRRHGRITSWMSEPEAERA